MREKDLYTLHDNEEKTQKLVVYKLKKEDSRYVSQAMQAM